MKLKNFYEGKPVSEITDEEIADYMFFLREELSYSASAQNIADSRRISPEVRQPDMRPAA